MRVFLDSNVLIRKFTARGLSADGYRIALAEHDLFLGAVVLDEARRILRTKFKLTDAALTVFDEAIGDLPVIPKPGKIQKSPEVRNQSDAWVLASAVAAKADVLVIGDADLLSIAAEAPLRIVSPRGFWELCRSL